MPIGRRSKSRSHLSIPGIRHRCRPRVPCWWWGGSRKTWRSSGPRGSRLVGCVAAGIPAFLGAAGAAAEGVLGPVQWLPTPRQPEVGPSGTSFKRPTAGVTERHPATSPPKPLPPDIWRPRHRWTTSQVGHRPRCSAASRWMLTGSRSGTASRSSDGGKVAWNPSGDGDTVDHRGRSHDHEQTDAWSGTLGRPFAFLRVDVVHRLGAAGVCARGQAQRSAATNRSRDR